MGLAKGKIQNPAPKSSSIKVMLKGSFLLPKFFFVFSFFHSFYWPFSSEEEDSYFLYRSLTFLCEVKWYLRIFDTWTASSGESPSFSLFVCLETHPPSPMLPSLDIEPTHTSCHNGKTCKSTSFIHHGKLLTYWCCRVCT